MRLIDADALNWWDDLYMKGVNNSGVWVRYRDVEKFIKDAPTVDPVEHAKRIDDSESVGSHFCSNCNSYFIEMYKFCPKCGARMDGEC